MKVIELRVKELAAQIGRHPNYVYAMKSKGFNGHSPQEAQAWVREKHFVIVRGRARIKS